MRRFFGFLVLLAIAGGAFGWVLTTPATLDPAATDGLTGDPAHGEMVFWAGGCASCHSAPEATDDQRLVLKGGRRFPSDFGTFIAPNISPDPTAGIGGWSLNAFANALQNGTSPEGQHYYPAFPYTTYTRASLQDVADLRAFLMTLPPDPTPSQAHEVGFPFSIRRSLGGWKLLFFRRDWVLTGDLSAQVDRGRYLVESLGHCGECHTPRNMLGGLDTARWLGGAPNPSGKGRIPNITPGRLTWSETDIAAYLKTGFTPEFDSAGGEMAEVVKNMSHLPDEDLAAIAAYLKAVPPQE